MGRLIGIDFGGKRTGLSETDDFQIIASPLKTVPTSELDDFLFQYIENKKVEAIVVGKALRWSGEENPIETEIKSFIERLQKKFPTLPIYRQDESGSSKQAMESMVVGGMKKSNRRKKENVDLISAVIILQNYLEEKSR